MADLRVFTVNRGGRNFTADSTYTDEQAAAVCDEYPARHADRDFALDLARQFRSRRGLTARQLPWLHFLANQLRQSPQPDAMLSPEERELRDQTTDIPYPPRRPTVREAAADRRRLQAVANSPELRAHTAAQIAAQDADMARMEAEADQDQTMREERARAEADLARETPTPPRMGVRLTAPRDANQTTPFRPSAAPPAPVDGPNLNLHILQYDVPTINGRDVYPNPSPILRRRAIRTTDSVWVIPEGQIPYVMLSELKEAGGRWHCFRFDDRESDKLLAMLRETLRDEVEASLKSMSASFDRAMANKTGKARDKHMDEAEKRVEVLMGDLAEAARVFGLSLSSLPMQRALGRVSALRNAAHAKADQYRAAAQRARAGGINASAVGRRAQVDQDVPAGILADVIEDEGGDASDLRAAFPIRDDRD